MSLWDQAVAALKDKDKQNIDFQRTNKHAILADILEEVKKKKQACIERRLKYKRKNGEFVVLYDVYEKMVKWVTKFKEVGDVAMQYDPGHAALPWAAIRFFLQIAVNDVQILGSLAEGLEEVCKIIARYAAIERLYLHQSTSIETLLENSIIALYTSILVFSKCRKYFDLGVVQRLAKSITQAPEQLTSKYLTKIAVNDDNVKELTRIINAERSQLSEARQSSMTAKIDNLGNDITTLQIGSRESTSKLEALLASFQGPLVRTVEQISTFTESLANSKSESQMKEERLQILRWLSDVHYKKHHQSIYKCLLEGTGSWLLRKPQFVEWRNSSVSSVLWLHGIPGSGKTCLTSTVIRQLLAESSACENAPPIAYFYCQRNTAEPQRSDPTEVLRAILRQLLCHIPLWQEASTTATEYRERKSEADEDGFEIPRLDISETTNQIIEIASQMPVTILIDALDECRSDQRHKLLGALDVLLERSAHLVKVFVSSRDDLDIVLTLQKHPNIYINIDDNKNDIHRFIKFEIRKALSDRRLLKGAVSSELTELITDTLAMKARGMFLWVSLQIENLCDSRRIKIEGDLVDELARLPRSLADMYALILENIGQIEQRGRTVAEKIFKWLLCTKDARSQVTIAACSGTGSTDYRSLSTSDILDVCSTLVVYDEALDRFRFAHLSVREFLESQPGYTPSDANRFVLERSLQTLMDDRSPTKLFRSYATLRWYLHYHRLEEQHRKEVFELHAKRFLFNGAETSEFFDIWAAEADRLRLNLAKSESLHSWAQDEKFEDEDHEISGDVQKGPIHLASYFGWLEILGYIEATRSPGDFLEAADYMMNIAIRYNRTPVVRWLFVRNFHPTHKHLDLAFCYRRSEIIQPVLEIDVISFDTLVNGREILFFAVRRGLWKLYWDLIKKGANRNLRDHNGRTLLSHAVSTSYSSSEIVEDLLLAGIDPLTPDNAGRTSIWFSIWGGYRLTPSSSSLTAQFPGLSGIEDGKKALRDVLQSSYYHTACLLLCHGLDSMLEDEDMRAEWMKSLELIAKLPSPEIDVWDSVTDVAGSISDDLDVRMQLAGQTLLSLAALFHHEEAFRVLLNCGIDPTCLAIYEVRQKLSTVLQTGHFMRGQEVLDRNREICYNRMSDELRQGPLAWAAYTGNLCLVQSILDRNLDPNIKNRIGQTALYFATQQTGERASQLEVNKEAIVRLLLQKGAIVTSADAYNGATVLANAFEAGYSKVAKIILDNGAAMPNNGPTEQSLAVFQQGHASIRQTLLERAQGAGAGLSKMQWSSSERRWSGDSLDIAARLALRGTMRILGDHLNSVEK